MDIIDKVRKKIDVNKIKKYVHSLNFNDVEIVNNKENTICFYTNKRNEYIKISYVDFLKKYKYTKVKENIIVKDEILNEEKIKEFMYLDANL